MFVNLSLVLPCYNEEKSIDFLCKEFLSLPLKDYSAELILVNNGSKDNTKIEIQKSIKSNSSSNVKIILVDLKNNKGYGGGISEGLKVASGDYIGWAHADLQTPLKDFLRIFEEIKGKKNILGKGYRKNNRGFDGIISRFHESLASLIWGIKVREINAQPKIFNKELMSYFKKMPEKSTLDTYIVYTCLVNKIEIKTIDVLFNTRKYGDSKWKNNFKNFISQIFLNIIYLFELRFSKKYK